MIPVGSGVGTSLGGKDGGFVLSTDGGGTMIDMTEEGRLVGTLVGTSVDVGDRVGSVEGSNVGLNVGNGVGSNVGDRVG